MRKSSACDGSRPTDADVLTPPECADILRISPRTLERWRQLETGPPWIKIGRRIAYRRAAVLEFIAEQETRGRGEKPGPVKIKEVTACAYIKDPARWHVDMSYTDPQTNEEIRKRRVAPAGLTLDGAIAWGQNERLRIVTGMFKVPVTAENREEKSEPTKKNPTIAEVWPEFLSRHCDTLKHGTRKGYGPAGKFILATLGEKRFDEIDAVAFEQLKDAMSRLEASSQRNYMTKFTKFLRWAMSKGKTQRVALPEIDIRVKKKRISIYSPENLEAILSAADDDYERVLVLLLSDGCLRIGEAAGLQWGDITDSGKHGTMKIVRNVMDGILQDSTKSGEDGEVPLTPRLAEALQQLRATAENPIWVLPRRAKYRKAEKKLHNHDRVLARHVKRLQRRAQLPVHGPHRIRHSRLTHLAERGLPLRALQHLARHASERTTERYYVHVRRVSLAAQAVDEIAVMTAPAGNDAVRFQKRPRIVPPA